MDGSNAHTGAGRRAVASRARPGAAPPMRQYMKAFLMHRDRDFDVQPKLPDNESALTQDLELDTLLSAMAGNDEFLFDVAHKHFLGPAE